MNGHICRKCDLAEYYQRCSCGEEDDQDDEPTERKKPFPTTYESRVRAREWQGMDGYRDVRE